ncbi:MAG: hypothetical protein RQ753_09150, partial [Desulfurivibrionaceae bacterium]|nr:hypothetical protein [Desulfurivibrionaceae bacterium]
MIPAEKLKLETAAGFPRDNFGWDRLPEPVLIDLDRLQAQLAANLFDPAAYLAPRELATFQGFAYQKRKIEWLGGRLAAKQAVLQLFGREPAAEAMREWVINADPYGKPFFIPPGHKFRTSRRAAQLSFIPPGHKFRTSRQAAQLSFNFRSGGAPCLSISHSQGLAAAMVSAQMECGLDIQKVSAATVRVKEKFCLAAEEEIIASLDLPEPPSFGLTLLWAGKEALRKA